MASINMTWRENDCLIDLFGDDAHEKLNFDYDSHDEALEAVVSLTEDERWDLFRSWWKHGWVRCDGAAQPGDSAIGNFQMAISRTIELPTPWFAMLGVDNLWYVRMPKQIKAVQHDGQIEVYRLCQSSQ